MLNPFKKSRKPRKYLIKKDESGQSLRKRAFALFDQGSRPVKISKLLNAKPATIYRYFEDWKKLPKNLESEYKKRRKAMRNPEYSHNVIKILSEYLRKPESEVIKMMQKPWDLKRLLTGQLAIQHRKEMQSRQETRLRAALNYYRF
jgi:hypothetical protein